MDRGRRIHERAAANLGLAPDQVPKDFHHFGGEIVVAENVALAESRRYCRDDYWRAG